MEDKIMPTAEEGILYYEGGQAPTAMVALVDSGDHIVFNSAEQLWSKRVSAATDYSPVVRPNGLINGGNVTPAVSGSNDKIDVAEAKCYLAGVETDVAADTDLDITRGLTTDTHIINSLTITSAGAWAVIAGTDNTAFSATRGAAGGPPWIPTGSIEIAQVRLTGIDAAVVAVGEIFQTPGNHRERWDGPTWDVKHIRVDDQVLGYAGIDFDYAVPQIHSDDAGSNTNGKKVYAEYHEPIFVVQPDAVDFKPPQNTYSVNSKQRYGRTKGVSSSALGAGGFTYDSEDGITDGLVKLSGQTLFFKFKPNRLKSAYKICQGKFGAVPSYPVDDLITVACTIAADEESQGLA
jgi:hypothetical protein